MDKRDDWQKKFLISVPDLLEKEKFYKLIK